MNTKNKCYAVKYFLQLATGISGKIEKYEIIMTLYEIMSQLAVKLGHDSVPISTFAVPNVRFGECIILSVSNRFAPGQNNIL